MQCAEGALDTRLLGLGSICFTADFMRFHAPSTCFHAVTHWRYVPVSCRQRKAPDKSTVLLWFDKI